MLRALRVLLQAQSLESEAGKAQPGEALPLEFRSLAPMLEREKRRDGPAVRVARRIALLQAVKAGKKGKICRVPGRSTASGPPAAGA